MYLSISLIKSNLTLSYKHFFIYLMTKQRRRPGITMSPSPSIEKWPALWVEGKTSLPGRERRGAFLTIPLPRESFRAIRPIGFSAGRVATRTITLALNTYYNKDRLVCQGRQFSGWRGILC